MASHILPPAAKMTPGKARMYLQLPLRQWGARNVYLLVLSSWKLNFVQNPITGQGSGN